MSDWNAAQYLKFKEQRTQPVRDLTAHIHSLNPASVVDIGCGPGNSTAVLAETFPQAKIVGIDTSENMLEKARANCPNLTFVSGDAQNLDGTCDLLFSNACLQWIPNHERLIPGLMGHLNPGGHLAVQMPRNDAEPLYRIIAETAAEPEWGLQELRVQPGHLLTPQEYYTILAGCSADFNLWETKYYHRMPDHQSLVDWVKGARLRPYLDALDQTQGAVFEHTILERVKAAYPLQKDGSVLFGFRRLFFTAEK